MKHTKTRLFALALALIMVLAFAACSNDNSGGGFSGVDHSDRPTSDPTNTPADTSPSPDPSSEPTGNGQEETPPPDPSTEPPTTTQPPSEDSWIIGMWRDPNVYHPVACQIFYADGSVIAIGLTEKEYYSWGTRYTYTVIDVSRGKYRLTGNTLEIFDLTGFTMSSRSVSDLKLYANNYVDVQIIVNTGSRSEVEQLINPKHTLYAAYKNDEWENWSSRTDEINILNADSFNTKWTYELRWDLQRVKE